MKIELILDVKPNLDAYYWIKRDGELLTGHCVYAGNVETNTPEESELFLNKANAMYDRVVKYKTATITVIKSIELDD
jgi:hypothetical protein